LKNPNNKPHIKELADLAFSEKGSVEVSSLERDIFLRLQPEERAALAKKLTIIGTYHR
jgi:hypothetical protein